MRAMILAAGYGTRLRPLSALRAKPALPVMGRPVIGFLLDLLARHGVDEVLINLHHRAETIEAAVDAFGPEGLRVRYQREPEPLGTGGGIDRARAFLCESDPCLVIAGDMLFDADLGALVAAHAARRDACTLVLRRDPRAAQFGTIGLDAGGRVRRIARRFDLGGETDAAVFVGVRVLSPAYFDLRPEPPDGAFEDLSDWIAPALLAGEARVGGHILEAEDSTWEPVGTPAEYLRVNLDPPRLSFRHGADFAAPGTRRIDATALVLGAGAQLPPSARLDHAVVWDDEVVPEGLRARAGVFAGGTFYACPEPVDEAAAEPAPDPATGESRNE